VYCNFSGQQYAPRRLTFSQILQEAEILYGRGLRHVLLVAGDDPEYITVDFLEKLVGALKEKFAGVSIEMAPLATEEYLCLAKAGLDGLTIYQETYDQPVYAKMHPAGRKSAFDWRYGCPARGGEAGLREVGIGFLLGLSDWRRETLSLAQHAQELLKKYWRTQFSISFPRIKPIEADFIPPHPVSDRELLQLIVALRLVFPQVDLTLSTREAPALRDQLIGVGITRMSAGSSTLPGGYVEQNKDQGGQFAVADQRSVAEVAQTIAGVGFDPVFKDWESVYYWGVRSPGSPL
jgi:2-iminoacetate synthase